MNIYFYIEGGGVVVRMGIDQWGTDIPPTFLEWGTVYQMFLVIGWLHNNKPLVSGHRLPSQLVR